MFGTYISHDKFSIEQATFLTFSTSLSGQAYQSSNVHERSSSTIMGGGGGGGGVLLSTHKVHGQNFIDNIHSCS